MQAVGTQVEIGEQSAHKSGRQKSHPGKLEEHNHQKDSRDNRCRNLDPFFKQDADSAASQGDDAGDGRIENIGSTDDRDAFSALEMMPYGKAVAKHAAKPGV